MQKTKPAIRKKRTTCRIHTSQKSKDPNITIPNNDETKWSTHGNVDLLKIAINCMFLLNGGAAVALINNNIHYYFVSVFIFASGAAMSVALALYLYFSSNFMQVETILSAIIKSLISYLPIFIFIFGLWYSVFHYPL